MLAKLSTGLLEIVAEQRQPPEARRPVCTVRARRERLLRLLHNLQNHLAKAKERLAWCARRGGLLADATQIQPCRLERLHAAVQVRRHRHDVVDANDSIEVLSTPGWGWGWGWG